MTGPDVLITDVVWDSIDIEARVLASAGLTCALAPAQDEATLMGAVGSARGVLTCFAEVTAGVMDAAPRLQVVSRYGVGLDNIDTAYAASHGIAVVNVPDYCRNEVASHAVAMGLHLWRRLGQYDTAMRGGAWGVLPDAPVRRLSDARVLVLGRGAIGSEVESMWCAFGVRAVDRPAEADIVSVHLPLNDSTRGLVDDAFLRELPAHAVLINTSRGEVVEVNAALTRLRAGRLGGLGLDVFPTEPYPVTSDWEPGLNLILTPHVAFYSEGSLVELRTRAAENLVAALAAIPTNTEKSPI